MTTYRGFNPVVTISKLPLIHQAHGVEFEAYFANINSKACPNGLGARLVQVPPGKRAWPHHAHYANEEMFVILSGEGMLRFGSGVWPVKEGDVVICPAGGGEVAHQLVAGDAILCYIAISTMREPDILTYPDSEKISIFVGSAPGGDKTQRRLEGIWMQSDTVGYWEGE